MSTVINTNIAAIRTHNVYNKNNENMNVALSRVATGMKINSAKDNSSVWAISEKMRERIRANDQANQNVQNDTALLKTAQDGMGNTLSILTTLKERAINSANDSNISSDRTKIVEEVRQLVAQIDDNAAKVKFNGRQLLNGGVESDAIASSSKTNSIVGTSAANAVTATEKYGEKAIYGVTGLHIAGTGAISDSTKLVSLLNDDGEALFQAGDKITFSWTDNGVEKQKTVAVASDTALSAINAATSAVKLNGAWVDAGSQVASATDKDGNNVITDTAGYFFSGDSNHNISNFSISVTNSSGVTREAAQAAFEPTAVQQSYGKLADSSSVSYGSNEVYNVAATNITTTSAIGDATQFYKFGADTKDTASSVYKIMIDDKQISFTGAATLNDINNLFKKEGINVELHYTAAAGDALTYDGKTVTQGTYGSEMAYGSESTAATQTKAGFNFVVANGEKINHIKIDGSSVTDGKFNGVYENTTATSPKITKAMQLDETTAGGTYGSTASSTLLPQGEALQFFVGGEQNFGVNFTIGKATVANLLGSDVDTFAKKFQTKEGAESALGTIETAINKTLTEQTRLGAMEARLGYTSDNLTSMNENLEAGVSAYRDADIAKEMTNYMKYAVLSQASQYMLAQSGQNAFSVLNLLQA